jgi:NADPH:quinone reductase-like Zn-dependent oxidoreductase
MHYVLLQAFEKARFRQDSIKRVFITAGHGSFGSMAIQVAKVTALMKELLKLVR